MFGQKTGQIRALDEGLGFEGVFGAVGLSHQDCAYVLVRSSKI